MKHLLLTWIGTALALLVTSKFVPGFTITSPVAALIAAVIIALVNAIVRPILNILAFPVTFITFGLFSFVINALCLLLASKIAATSGFRIDGFVPAFLGSIVLSIASTLINYFMRLIV
jgi:putative membrane protein